MVDSPDHGNGQTQRTGSEHPRPLRPFTLSAAAQACGVSRSTIRRHLDAKRFSGAYRDDSPLGPGTGPWLIPLSDLLAAGLHPNSPRVDDGLGQRTPSDRGGVQDGQDPVLSLRHDLELERARRQAAEKIADERAHTIEALELALRLLEAPAQPAADDQPESQESLRQDLAAARARIVELEASPAASQPAPTSAQRRWWAPWRRPREASPASS